MVSLGTHSSRRAVARDWGRLVWRPYFFGRSDGIGAAMLYFFIKAAISGLIAAAVSEIARRFPGWGGLVASLPLTSLMAMIWLWRDSGDVGKLASLSTGAMWFILPSLPMFLIIPWLIRSGAGFWLAMGVSVAITLALYAGFFWLAPKIGIAL